MNHTSGEPMGLRDIYEWISTSLLLKRATLNILHIYSTRASISELSRSCLLSFITAVLMLIFFSLTKTQSFNLVPDHPKLDLFAGRWPTYSQLKTGRGFLKSDPLQSA